MNNVVFRKVCFVVAVFVIGATGGMWSIATGQTFDRSAIVQTIASSGGGTGFVVAKSNTSVEIWTAAHCTDGIGTAVSIVWPGGERTTARVERYRYEDGIDSARLVGPRPVSDVAIVAVSTAGDGTHDCSYHSGFGDENRFSIRAVTPTDHQFQNRQSYQPTCKPGDSGGPVVNESGEVIGVTVQRSVGRVKLLLAAPITDWIDLD